jgi:ribosomal protein S18 acetylase RimI-like enzyme
MSIAGRFTADRYEAPTARGDTLALTRLSAEEGERFGALFATIDPWAAYGYAPATLSAFLSAAEPGAPRLRLSVGPDTAGAAVIRPGWLRGPYLQFLAVIPAMQGRGIGGALLQLMEREARMAGERNLWVAASEINDGAMRLYERYGFKRIARLDDLAWDGRAEILFRKKLV